MGLHTVGGTQTQNVGTEKQSNGFSNSQTRTASKGPRVGFGGVVGGSNFLTNRNGSEYTTSLGKEIKKYITSIEGELSGLKPDVIVLDREVVGNNLSYSVIVVASENKEADELRYFTILLSSTGMKPLTAGEMRLALDDARNSNSRPRIYTLDDAMNERLHQIICTELAKRYSANTVYQVDGMILSELTDDLDIVERGANIGASAINAIYGDMLEQDLNITESLRDFPNCSFNITSNLNSKSTTISPSGTPVRSDFSLTLNLQDNYGSRDEIGMNSDSTNIELAKVVGFIDALPEVTEIDLKLPTGQLVKEAGVRMRPNIVITGIGTAAPTSGFALLAVLTSMQLAAIRDQWVKALFPTDKKLHVGFLNKICQIGGTNAPLQLADNKYSDADISDAILSMFTLDPIISLDIENYGPQAYYTSVFSMAASPFNSQDREDARKHIIALASELTNGNFNPNFPTNAIFADEGICIPMGYYNTNQGVKDIRDIDMTFIASRTDDIQMITSWQESNYPYSDAVGIEPFITKLNVISDFVKDAVITSKAIRVTFTGEFLTELLEAAARAGFVCKYKSDFSIKPISNIGVVRGTLNRGAIGSNLAHGAFNNTYGGRVGSVNYRAGYGRMGYGRW